jgi:lipid A ethanolaminephosphotransferase
MHVMSFFKSFALSRSQILVLSALWISLLPNLASLQRLIESPSTSGGMAHVVFALTGWLILFALILFFLSLLGLLFPGRGIKLWCAIAIVVASILGYYSFFLGTLFDKTMFANILGTHPSETLELIGVRMLSWIALVGVLPAVFITMCRMKVSNSWLGETGRSAALLVLPLVAAAIAVFPQFQSFASAGRNKSITFHTVAPINLLAAAVSHVATQRAANVVRDPVGTDAKIRYELEKPRLVVFVLGETARAQNQALNGYSRPTNDRMIAEHVINFPYTESCGTATAMSVPCLFSGFTREEFSLSKAASRETLIDVISRAGMKILWRENDGGCKGVCDRGAIVEDVTNSDDPRFCTEKGNCFDAILLDGLEERLKAETKSIFVVLHIKGSHGPAYFKRYPKEFERFTPACKSNELSSCSSESLKNAYDNTIVYTDHILGEVVSMLKRLSPQFATSMLYASDHGESLGERGLYLHGLPYAVAPEEQTRVPMFAWFSPQFLELERWSEGCVRRQSEPGKKHDHIYSTLLGLLDISTDQYKPELDIFSACEREAQSAPKKALTPNGAKTS